MRIMANQISADRLKEMCQVCAGVRSGWWLAGRRRCRRERECLQAEILELMEYPDELAAESV